MRCSSLVFAALLVIVPPATAQFDQITAAILNTDGPWVAAARAAGNARLGVDVSVYASGGEPLCDTPIDLLTAEAELILRRADFEVRPRRGMNGAQVSVDAVSLALSGQLCVTTLHMALLLQRYQDASESSYFGDVVVDDALVILAHPASQHREVLRERVNQQVTVWANDLAQHRAR